MQEALLAKERALQEVEDLSEAWEADRLAWQQQRTAFESEVRALQAARARAEKSAVEGEEKGDAVDAQWVVDGGAVELSTTIAASAAAAADATSAVPPRTRRARGFRPGARPGRAPDRPGSGSGFGRRRPGVVVVVAWRLLCSVRALPVNSRYPVNYR